MAGHTPSPASRRPYRRGGVLHADLCVIGAGAAGLALAAGAAQLGAAVVLVEKHRMGGDCLNSGCVPSKALLAAARAAAAARRAARFGIAAAPAVDAAAVMRHVRQTIATLAPHDSEERFRALGVEVIRAPACFLGPDVLAAGEERIRARRFAIATGSRPAVPPIPGLGEVPFLTNETIFDLAAPPPRLLVLGGGPMGAEMAQAFARLGSEVVLIERQRLLPREEPEAAAVLRARLAAEGISLREGAEVIAARQEGEGIALDLADGQRIAGSHLLLAAGRVPNVEGLGLAAAGVATTAQGVAVDAARRSRNRRIFALGDVAGGPAYTHAAARDAAVVIRTALFGLPARAEDHLLPAAIYTDPEIARVGPTEAAARTAGERVQAVLQPLASNDRAVAEAEGEGFVKLLFGRRGRLLGGTIVAPHAGEMIGLLALACARGLGAAALAQLVLPYPTMAEAIKRAAGAHLAPVLFGAPVRRLVGLVQRLLP